jgi:L-lactate dehydrogenase complex protein LldE
MAEISGAMLAKKMNQIRTCPADVLTGDLSCMLHINGGLEQTRIPQRVQHIAEVLAEAVKRN